MDCTNRFAETKIHTMAHLVQAVLFTTPSSGSRSLPHMSRGTRSAGEGVRNVAKIAKDSNIPHPAIVVRVSFSEINIGSGVRKVLKHS